jgi:serine/threonine protein kinase
MDTNHETPRLVAKITDFGVSSVAGLSSTMRSTTAGNAVGTTSYKAPELFNRKVPLKQRYSKAIDIYAFGVLANELFANEIPWADCNAEDIAFEVRDGGRPVLFTPTNPEEEILLKIVGDVESGCFAEDRFRRPEASSLCHQLPNILYIPPENSKTTAQRPHVSIT